MKKNKPAHTTAEFDRRFDNNEDIHDLIDMSKVKVSRPGRRVRITLDSKDIRKLNKKKCFHEIVAKENIYSKVVKKEDKSAEGEIVTSDVV